MRLSEIRTDPLVNRSIDQSWVDKLVRSWNPDAMGIPVVAAVNGHFVVLDGQHRLEALRQMSSDDPRVEVQVKEGLSTAEQAGDFVTLNERRGIRLFEKFTKRVTAEDATAAAIARIVTNHGLQLGITPTDGHIAAVGALEAVFNFDKIGTVLDQTLGVLVAAYGPDWHAFNNNIIRGLGTFIYKFPDHDNERLVRGLAKSSGGCDGLLGRGRIMRDVHGGSVASGVAEAVLSIYNRGLKNKLA